MSSEKLENLQEDLVSALEKIFQKLEYLQKSVGESKKVLLREVEREIDEADSVLKEIQTESDSAPISYRQQVNHRIRQYKSDLERANNKLNVLSNNSSRKELFGQRAQAAGPADFGERSKVLQINETLTNTSRGIERTHQIAAETDAVGVTVISELDTQREALLRTRERLDATDVNMSRSRKILRSMYRRVITDKLILIVIILIELGIVGLLIYLNVKKHTKKSS
ncbi:vesicle transport through interaction with t-SNAREs homolog 1B-like [Centruroides sculpturatus]|uniref:vesicle transport through interaction with t-SNAREs homolog 1B-like n=1 Tax=Centruroides sculpturatus TaxID=218467 RepID=UPI000C6D0FA1|nr:vesicle transport through interaction with t-SNAREs homolog 1B-like [Centruroides sculpturatus]